MKKLFLLFFFLFERCCYAIGKRWVPGVVAQQQGKNSGVQRHHGLLKLLNWRGRVSVPANAVIVGRMAGRDARRSTMHDLR